MNASITSVDRTTSVPRYRRVLTVLGTRPEAIKFAPVVRALEQAGVEHAVCSTGQHREMLAQVFNVFGLKPTYDLQLMSAGQALGEIAGAAVAAVTRVIAEYKPDLVLVQGDTTTAFAGAAAAFYSRVAVGHVEAGLRTGDLQSPFPEEANRKLIGVVGDWHFAPTSRAQANLLKEGIDPRRILITGNTGIDALRIMRERLLKDAALRGECEGKFGFIDPTKKLVLVTGHRRENFGEGLARMFAGLKRLAQRPDVQIVYPVHLNPNVKGPAHAALGGVNNLHLIAPVEYHEMIYLMERSSLIITDSGGIQEEAPSFGVPLLVTRDVTERQEAVEAGCAKLIGTDPRKMLPEAIRVLENAGHRVIGAAHHNPFGDGYAATRICAALMGVPDAVAPLQPPSWFCKRSKMTTNAPLFCRATFKFWLMVTSAVAIAAASTVAFGAEAVPAKAAPAAPKGPFRPYLERSFELSDMNFANPLIFSGAEYGQQIFFAIPRDVRVHDVAIDIDGNYLRSDLGHSAFVASVNDIPGFALEPKDASGAFNRTINVAESLLTEPFVKLDLRYSSIVSEDRCTEQRSIANVITVSPHSKLRYRVNAGDVKDVRSAWGMLPSRPTILIPAGALDETHYAAALKLALAMSAAGRQPKIVTAPAVGDVVDVSGLAVPADLARIPAFQALATRDSQGQEKVKLANQAERGAYALLGVLHGRAAGEVAIGAKWLAAQTKGDIAALTAEAEQAGPDTARALTALLAALPTTAKAGAEDNLTLETVLGQPVITLANDASRAASLLATQWSRLANAEGLDVAFAGSEPADMNAIQLGEFGGNLSAQSIIQYGEWVTAFDAAQLPAGRWPSNIELEMRVSPDASDVSPLVTVMLNDVLLRAEKVNANSETVRLNADVPPYLLASRNTLRISLQRGPSSGDCRTLNRGYLAQILPTSRLVLGNETIDGQFFGLKSKLANGALIAVPKAYLATPTQSLPYVFQFLRELKVSSSSIRLRTVDDAATYRPEATFVSFGIPLPGKRKNLQAANNTLLLTDENGLPIANVNGARDAAVVQIVSLGEVAGLSVNSTTGKPIPGIQVNDLGEGDVAIYDASGRIGDLGAGEFRMVEIKRALLSPSALFHRYSIWIMTGVGVLLAMLIMSATRAFVVARKRRRVAEKAEHTAAA